MMIDIKPVVLTFTLGAVALGCADDERVPEEGGIDCADPKGCKDGNAGADEVGDGDADGDDAAEHDACITDPKQGMRTIHQCNGHVTASFDFMAAGKDCAGNLGGEEFCTETHTFGVGEDDYELPAVMACCDEETSADELLTYCAADLVAQVCHSIPKRLEAWLEAGLPGVDKEVKGIATTQVKNLLWYLVENKQKCFDALHKPGAPGLIADAVWLVNGGNNDNWWALKDFTVRIDKGVIMSTHLPDGGRATCEGNRENDTEIFEESGPVSPIQGVRAFDLSNPALVWIQGPTAPGSSQAMAYGSASVASQSVCERPRCSSLAMGEDDERLVIEDLNLYADAPVPITMGDAGDAMVNELGLRLYGFADARPLRGNREARVYVIERGAALFLALGSVGDTDASRWVRNATPIVVHVTAEGVTLEGFEVEYTDVFGAWMASIPVTTWD
jgi:hypothetical protein